MEWIFENTDGTARLRQVHNLEYPPPGWRWGECPAGLLADTALAESLRNVGQVLRKSDGNGCQLGFLWSQSEPFPIPPLFCLTRFEQLGGKWYVIFQFSGQNRPKIPEESCRN